jgi:hypothetical protein
MEFFKAANDAQQIAGYLKEIVKERLQQLEKTHAKEPNPIHAAEKPEESIVIPYKYYLNARPADSGSIPKNFVRLDEQD